MGSHVINFMTMMKKRIDNKYGRSERSKHMSTVEPVFEHLAGKKLLNSFSLWEEK